ncbi:MAG: hypothetical protein WCQ72_07410, partial [Eubacteriales bacterium]
IYCPLSRYLPKQALIDGNADEYKNNVLSSLSFELKSASQLEHFKLYMNKLGYSGVNLIDSIRCFVMLSDAAYLSSANAISQRIWYMDRAFPIVFALVLLLAVLVPRISIGTRRYESAVMRAQGASGVRIFFCFFDEQLLLCAVGVLLGFAVCYLNSSAVQILAVILSAAFFLIWLFGSAAAISSAMRSPVTDKLKGEE